MTELIAIVVAILTLSVTTTALVVTINHFKKQLQLSFFAEYTKRYQDIILNFPEAINDLEFSISALEAEEKDRTLRYMRAYFDLCSEEFYLWKKGHVDDATWGEWEAGIRFAFSKPAFQQAWRKLNLDTIYYGDFSRFVEESMMSATKRSAQAE